MSPCSLTPLGEYRRHPRVLKPLFVRCLGDCCTILCRFGGRLCKQERGRRALRSRLLHIPPTLSLQPLLVLGSFPTAQRTLSRGNSWLLASLESVRAAELSDGRRRTSTGVVGWCAYCPHTTTIEALLYRRCMPFSLMRWAVVLSRSNER